MRYEFERNRVVGWKKCSLRTFPDVTGPMISIKSQLFRDEVIFVVDILAKIDLFH
jgi:hypothetical protein